MKNEKWNEKDMQKNDAETGCSKRSPRRHKGKEKEATSRRSEAPEKFRPRRKESGEVYLPLKGGGPPP